MEIPVEPPQHPSGHDIVCIHKHVASYSKLESVVSSTPYLSFRSDEPDSSYTRKGETLYWCLNQLSYSNFHHVSIIAVKPV